MKNQQSSSGKSGAIGRTVALLAFAMALPGLAIASSSTNKGANPNGKPFIELNGVIVEVEGEISSLQDQVDAIIGQVGSIEEAQAAMDAAIAGLENENAGLQAQIDANATDVGTLETAISDLNSEVMVLEQQIADLGDPDGALQAEIETREAQITTLALSIDTLEGNLQATIENNKELIIILTQEIAALDVGKQDTLKGSCAAGEVITRIRPDGSVVCSVLSGTSGTVSTYIVRSVSKYPYEIWNQTPCSSCTLPAGYRVGILAKCNDGDVAVHVGWHGVPGVEYLSVMADGPYGVMDVKNNNGFPVTTTNITTCLHQN